MNHFLRLARSGHQPYASSGETRAFKAAQVAIDVLGGLDDEAFAGFLEFAKLARTQTSVAAALLSGEVRT